MKSETKKENWDNYWNLNKNSRFTRISWSKKRIIKVLEQYIEPRSQVLDAGCGSGFFSNFFVTRDCEVYALDYSDDALGIAKKITNNKAKEYVKADLLDSAVGEKYKGLFDVVFTDGLFEHFSTEDQNKILQNFLRMKKKEGVIITFVPNKYSWWEIVRPFFMPGIKEVPFTQKKLLELHAGLEVVENHGLNVLPMRFSPEVIFGKKLGMLIYVVAR